MGTGQKRAHSKDTLNLIEDAFAHVSQALDALREILKNHEQSVTVDGIEHELHGLEERLRSLCNDVAAEDERGE
jgi:Zn-dependent M32 family carboxypeptidase